MKFQLNQNESSRINNDGMYARVRLIIGEIEVQYCAL